MLLNEGELAELIGAAVQSGVYFKRAELITGIPLYIIDGRPQFNDKIEQLRDDLRFLNLFPPKKELWPTAPLEIWLKNAIALCGGSPEQAIFIEMLRKVIIKERPANPNLAAPPNPPPGFKPPMMGGYGRPAGIPLVAGGLAGAGGPPLRDDGPPHGNFFSDAYERLRSLGNGEPTVDSEPLKPAQPPTGTEAAPPKTPERVVNTGFAPSDRPREPAARDQCLNPASDYYFWLEVGKALEKSIERKPMALPAELLPENAELTVVLFANPNGFELDPNAD